MSESMEKIHEEIRAMGAERAGAARRRQIRRWALAGAGIVVAALAVGLGFVWAAVRVARGAWGSP